MHHLPVHWYDGMYLRPQHFQAAERHWTELLRCAQQWSLAYNYGLREIEIGAEALANHQVQLIRCRACLKDGTLIELAPGQEPDRVDLKEAFEKSAAVTVYLAAPKLALGRRNVTDEEDQTGRYCSIEQMVQDETEGGNEQDLQFRQLNVSLKLSTDNLSGYETLPIARIKRAGESNATPQIDESYVPPLLAVDAWRPLAIGIVRGIYDILGNKIEVLSRRVAERGISLASRDPGDLDDLLMLMTANGGYGTLNCLTFAAGVHPFPAYQELCRLVSQLSIFDANRRPPEIPAYDHDDLATIFLWAMRQIERLLGASRVLEFEQRYFTGTDRGMQVTIDPKWLHSGWDWYVGVLAESITEQQCRELLRPGQLDWKMGSGQQVDLIFKHGIPGVEQVELERPPRGLPTREGWVYYEVRREGNAYRDVLATQSLAMRFTEGLISNLDHLRGEQKLEVLTAGKRAVLQFALFAVPPRPE